MEIDSPDKIPRKQSSYRPLDDAFQIQKETYGGQQYSQIYFARLHVMRSLLTGGSLVSAWKPNVPVCNILGLEGGKECIIIGTLYKHMKLKPMILDEYSKERSAVPTARLHNFVHQDDYLVLEDESGRVKLGGSVLRPSIYVTGTVVALFGRETGSGEFHVEDVLEAGLPPQLEMLLKSGEDKYVVLVSGINVGNRASNPLELQLFIDHITGHLGDKQEQGMAAEIVQLIIAGNSVEIPHGILHKHNLAATDQSKLSEPIKELDMVLTQIAAGLPLDIMPGPNDPANFSLPQVPLHRCLFPSSATYNTFRSCPNPHSFEIDGVKFLGTSGQNIDDLEKYSEAKDKLEYMERTLKWRHLAPTAPNTLGCYPFTDRDPFLVESCPHVYFVGNQDNYATRLVEGSEGQVVRLICIPKFSETGVAVMVNLHNLECSILSFKAQFTT